MKAHRSWHSTPFGRVARFLGGLRLAVPVLVLTAIALAWGTYLDSTQGASVAMRVVYGSPWFIAIMALVCVSLIFAVVTRFPWQRRHVGFISVHASLILLIVAGFWSLFGREEGRVALQEGQQESFMETTEQRLELLEMINGVPTVVAAARAEKISGRVRLDDVVVEVTGRWGNIAEEQYVADDGPEPLRAIELIPSAGMSQTMWIGQASRSGGPAAIGGMSLRLLGPNETWAPPAAVGDQRGKYFFVREGQRYELGEVGSEVFPGWRVAEIKRFKSAMVGQGGLTEGDGDNPAVDVTITDGKGTVERHTAFEKFPDMVMPGKRLSGDAVSGASLTPGGNAGQSLVVHGPIDAIKVTYYGADGSVQEVSQEGPLPWTFEIAGRRMTIVNQVSRARMASRFVEAPVVGDNYRPALLVRLAGVEGDSRALAWKSTIPLIEQGRTRMLRYGPRIVHLPFTVYLKDFRKMDYPGTQMAMAYESDVRVAVPGQGDQDLTIFMNNPYVHGPWKVYQSGFVGDDLSIFSVMKDPGLTLTYISCTTLCLGMLVTFYSRAFSAGHPGIAMPFAKKEQGHASSVSVAESVRRGSVRSGLGARSGLEEGDGLDPGAARGAGDAAGHVRAAPGGAVDGTVEVGG
ncbi:MAG: cytochrome c biogenesis protein ResB [Phycisphaerales bacterium]|nr:cytochrome c biogenesis protein ResB [Phycisphaerales bacterium]